MSRMYSLGFFYEHREASEGRIMYSWSSRCIRKRHPGEAGFDPDHRQLGESARTCR